MLVGLLCALGIVGNLANDAYHHNQKIRGTERDIFKDNPRMQEIDREVDKIIARGRREYEERTGKKAYW